MFITRSIHEYDAPPGIDMAHAFLKHLVGDETTNVIRGIVEVGVRDADDDEFAEFHNLI